MDSGASTAAVDQINKVDMSITERLEQGERVSHTINI